MTQKIRWFRLSAEAVAIVASILFAFGIDAWWESRSDARQERVLLNALAEDFANAGEQLSETKSRHTGVARAGEQLLTYGEIGSVPVSERDNVDILVSRHFDRDTYDPPMGTVGSVLGSGRIDLLTNQRLLTELTQWSAAVAHLRFRQIYAIDHFNERFYPYISSRLDLEDVDKGFAQFVDFPWEQEPAHAYQLVADQDFLNIVYMHWVLTKNVLDAGLAPVEESIETIQALIEAELSK